jgi:hypothetical protein
LSLLKNENRAGGNEQTSFVIGASVRAARGSDWLRPIIEED